MIFQVLRAPRSALIALAAIAIALASAAPALASSAEIVIDAKTGKVLSSRNADQLRHPASLTKMMTLYMVFEALNDGRLRWDQKIKMSKNGARTTPTKLFIPAGKTFTVREAVNGMIVKSANDVAEAMGDHLGGNEAKFAQMMTRKARQLGMSKTIFYNASGLPHRRQVTTARDMAKLGIALRRDFPREYKLFSQSSFSYRGKRIRGHNNLMYRFKGMDGIKTGYTNASGFNLVSSVNQNGRHVVGVVIGGRTARSRDDRMAAILGSAIGKASAKEVLVAERKKKTIEAARDTGIVVAAIAPTPKPRQRDVEQIIARAEKNLSKKQALAAVSGADDVVAAGGGWEVQIAAADSKAQANAILTRARKALSGEFEGLRSRTEAVDKGSKTLHRARLTGFDSRQTAQAACSALKSRDYDCMVVN